MYDDAYATCARTYATLCFYPEGVDPTAVTDRLGIEPKTWQRRGEVARRIDGPPRVATIDGWFLESRGQVDSRDSRRHIDWLLDRVEPKAEAVRSLQEMGCRMVVSCYWLSRYGQGGPTLSAIQMKRLGELGFELWFDIYGPAEGSPDEPGSTTAS